MIRTATLTSKPRSPVAIITLALVATACIVLWRFSEHAFTRFGSDTGVALQAAQTMARASTTIHDAKVALGLLQGTDLDPNRTGLIGPEWSEIVTTVGNLRAKRTLTNPDFAALLVRIFHKSGLRAGDPVAVIVSGSFVGGNVAVASAAGAFGLRLTMISSLGASMYGAADPGLTWLDMEAAVRTAGIWPLRSSGALLGGEAGMARDLESDARQLMLAAIARSGVPLIAGPDFATTVRASAVVLGLASGPDEQTGNAKAAVLINVGGSQVALGDCPEAENIPPGLITRPISCSHGTRGLIQLALDQGVPVLNLFKVQELARRYGLPLDPIPLPPTGANPFIYAQ